MFHHIALSLEYIIIYSETLLTEIQFILENNILSSLTFHFNHIKTFPCLMVIGLHVITAPDVSKGETASIRWEQCHEDLDPHHRH